VRMFGKELHWVSRKAMISCLLLALAIFLGHHAFFSSLVGHVVGDAFEQQRTRL
jgi:hypothetical protein